jgi:hypothetical protein
MALCFALLVAATAAPPRAWMDPSDPPAVRAKKLLGEMTLEEKLVMLHGPLSPCVHLCHCWCQHQHVIHALSRGNAWTRGKRAGSQWLRMHAVGGGGQWMDVDFLLWSKCAWAFSRHRLLAPLSRNMQKQHSLLQVKRLSSHACISARSMLSRSPRARASESPAECRAASATTRVGSLTRRAHTRATLRQTSVWAFPLST